MSDGFTITRFRDVADGLQAGQFAVGERRRASSLDDLDPIHRDLRDRPITVSLGVMTPDGRIGLTPMWFDYEGDRILVNTASHRSKCGWIRANPEMTVLIVNPDNPYHWVQIRGNVEEGGERVTRQLDRIWMKYIPARSRLTACATPRSTRSGCCSSAASTASPPSASPPDPLSTGRRRRGRAHGEAEGSRPDEGRRLAAALVLMESDR